MDVNSILNSVMGSAGAGLDKAGKTVKSGSKGSGLLGGAAAGGLVALLMSNKKARKMGKKALKYGGVAAVGGLAYKAWNDHKSGQSVPVQSAPVEVLERPQAAIAAPPKGSIFDLAQDQNVPALQDMRLILVRAMISAAKADGHIDAEERARIEQQIQVLEIGPAEQQFLVDQLNAPSDPITIAQLSAGPEQAAEIYAASALAVDIDTPEERRYLDRLADALHLPQDLRHRLEAETEGY